MHVIDEIPKEEYFDTYWQQRNIAKVSKRAEWRAEKLLDWVGASFANLLDVGAGNGDLLRLFMNRGYRTEGWDISPQAVERLQQRGHRAKVVDIEDEEVAGYYDVVSCSELLQHLKDPVGVLRKLEVLLAPKGRIFISVPNEFHFVRLLRLVRLEKSHITLFSPRKAKELVAICDLEIEKRAYQPLVPPRWGGILHAVGELFALLWPSMFSLSTLILVKRKNED